MDGGCGEARRPVLVPFQKKSREPSNRNIFFDATSDQRCRLCKQAGNPFKQGRQRAAREQLPVEACGHSERVDRCMAVRNVRCVRRTSPHRRRHCAFPSRCPTRIVGQQRKLRQGASRTPSPIRGASHDTIHALPVRATTRPSPHRNWTQGCVQGGARGRDVRPPPTHPYKNLGKQRARTTIGWPPRGARGGRGGERGPSRGRV